MERFSALIGFVVILAIAIGLSNNRRAIRWRTVMWGLILQILTAIAVLKGELIAQWLSAIALPITQNIVAIIFIALTIVLYQIAKRLPPETRRVIWYSFGVVTLYFFLTYNLLGPHGIPIEGEWYTGTFRDVFFGTLNRGAIDIVTVSAYDVAKRDKRYDSTSLPLGRSGSKRVSRWCGSGSP